MSVFEKPQNIIKVFHRLGFWSIPLLATPLIVLFGVVQSLSPSLKVDEPRAIAPQQPKTENLTVSKQEPTQIQSKVIVNHSPSQNNQKQTHTHTAKESKKIVKKPSKAEKNNKQSQVAKQPKYNAPAIEIRVAIAKEVSSLLIGASTAAKVLDANGKQLQKLPADQGIYVQPNGSSLSFNDGQLPAAIWIEPTKDGVTYIGDRWYRGRVLLLSQGNTMMAVNYVDLEHYLYSVVGSEMHPTAPEEALKAQAVAARSYALVHLIRPASSWYDLGATQRWQVYKGLNSEYNTTHQAVKETAGQIMSYQGGIVETLYAASDEIVAKAHGGMGMSQTGAYKLAEKGYNYQQILTAYYPGAETARLETKQ